MKILSFLLRPRLAAYAACLVGVIATVRAGTFTNNFDNGLPSSGITVFGNADPANADTDYDMTTGGFGGSGGCLKLTADKSGQQSAAVLDDLDAGKTVGGFEMWFKLLLHSDASAARPADGLSVSFPHGDSVPTGSVGEEGTGTGLVIEFDTYDNGNEAPAIDVKLDGNEIYRQRMDGPLDGSSGASWANSPVLKDSAGNPVSLMTASGVYTDVHILFKDNLLSVSYKGVDVYKNVLVPFTPYAGQFVFGGRTGGAFEFNWIDNLGIVTFPPSTTPLVTGFSSTPLGFDLKITDGTTQLDASSLKLTLDGTAITPTVNKSGSDTSISYGAAAPLGAIGSVHPLVLIYADSAGTKKTNTFSLTVPNYATIPADSKLATAPSTRGMSTFTYQISAAAAWRDENLIRDAEMRLVGGKVDPTTGKPYPNVAEGSVSNNINYVNWEGTGSDVAGEFFGSATTPTDTAISNDPIPGVPTTSSSTDHETVEVVTYLQFTKGYYRMGVASDDGFVVTAGQPGPLGLQLGSFDGGRGVAESTFEFMVPEDGVYPFRLAWWNGTGGANCEWYMVDRATGSRYLINGPQNNPLAIKAFRDGNPRAYLKSISPANNFYFADAKQPLKVTLVDGATQVANGSIKLSVNGADVTAAANVQKSGSTTTVTYAPAGGLPYDKIISGQIIWQESTTPPTTWTNAFQFATAGRLPYDYPAGAFWIEAEDFDNNGKEVAAVDTMPYTGGAYDGMAAVGLVDYNNDDNPTDTSVKYRYLNGDSSQGLTPYVDFYSSTAAMLSADRPQNTTMTANYAIGWSGASDWYNYTRKIPQGVYTAYSAMSYDDGANSPFDQPTRISGTLGKVTAGVGTSSQSVESIGNFTGPSTGGWAANNLAPLYAPDGTPAYFKIDSATTTLRVGINAGDYDYIVLAPATGVPPKIVSLTPNLNYTIRRDATLTWTVEDFSTSLDTSSVSLSVDGAAVPSATLTVGAVSGSTDKHAISYKPAALFDIGKSHSYTLSFKASDGSPITSSGTFMANYLPETPAGAFWIEAEDFNYNGGKSNPQAGVNGLDVNVMPYLGNAYTNLSAVFGIDYENNDNPTDSGRLYRYVTDAKGATNNIVLFSQWGAIGTGEPTDVTGTSVDVRTIAGGVTNSVTQGYRIGWSDSGDWCDYTRTIPAGQYQAWAALSYGGTGADQLVGWLYQVSGDATTTNQTANLLGRFDGTGSGNWGVNALVPLRTTSSHDTQSVATDDAAVITLAGGPTTLRFQLSSGDYDYFMLVPTSAQQNNSGLKITSVKVTGGNINIAWQGGGTLQTSTDLKAWTDVAASTSPYNAPASEAHRYFRVRQ